jgi:hypothetical protein
LGADGSRTPEQIKQWSLYVADILRIMAGAFGTGTEVSRKSTQVGQAAACMYENMKNLLSVDLKVYDTTCPLPLCTPTAMLNIYTMWSEVNDAVTEVCHSSELQHWSNQCYLTYVDCAICGVPLGQ